MALLDEQNLCPPTADAHGDAKVELSTNKILQRLKPHMRLKWVDGIRGEQLVRLVYRTIKLAFSSLGSKT